MFGKENRLNILMIDDDKDDIYITQRRLKKANVSCNFFSETSGFNLFVKLAELTENKNTKNNLIILLDINMPIVNGLDVLTLLKTKSPYKNIPVIMLCTSDDESYMNDSFSYGADAYLVKPINTEDFRFAIDNLRGVKL
ncbi:response regulator [Hyphomicrobiales bacterium 4NK60-0047b]|jgi:CheY-like chemotaxis protein